MIRDIYKGALSAALTFGAQYADAQDAAQETVLRALGREVRSPRAFARTTVRRILGDQAKRRTMDALPNVVVDRTEPGIDVRELAEALKRCEADRWHRASKGRKEAIKLALAREGWGT